MVISNTNTKSIYNCNGTTRNFNLGFVFDENVSNVGISVKHADGTTEQIEENYEIVEGVLTYPTVESELDPLPEGDKIIIERFTPLTQTINLTQQGPLDAETLEGGYDKNTLISQELQEQINRAIKFPVADDGETDAQEYINDLQDLVTEATTQAGIATTKAGDAATSATAADTAKTTAQKWAEGTDAQVEELGGTHSAKGWADYTEDVIENSGIDQLVEVIDDIQTVAGISSDVSQVAGISSAVQTVSSHDSEVTLVSDNMASVMTTASNISDVNAVAGNATNINTIAGISSDVTTVSTNATAVTTTATNMAAIIAAPTAAQNAATSATNAQTWAEGTDTAVTALGGEHSSKGWANVAKQYAESIGAALKYKGSVATYSALPATGQQIGDFWNVLDTGKNYAWTGTEWDDVSGVVDLSAYRTSAQQDVIDGNLSTAITNHTGNTSNPHSVTKAQVGLGNVDNTADLDKPISTATQTALNAKQDTLVSGTNIKTVNGNSLLGSGNVNINGLPAQTGQSGKFLTTDGTDASWANVDALPSQTGQNGKFLTTDGSAASWADIPTEVDNQSVTLNSSDQIQAIGVIDQNTSAANKIWTGTKAEYDAIATKDPNTTYRTTDENETVYQNSYRIGQVLPSILPISDYGLHLLDGAVIDGTGIYSSFYSYIAGLVSTYPNLFISEADWQTAVTTYGVCGKFVYDSTNQTIRLPKITGIIEGTPDVTALGDLVQAGLPNITGGMSPTGLADVSFSYGAFYDELNNTTDYQANTRGGYGVRWGFNAARSSSIYGNSNTVQPQTIKVYYYIVIANSYQTPTGVQISKVATDLNGKVNLNSSWGMPSNTYTELSIPSSGSYIQAPSDGYLVFFGNLPNGSRFKMQANADIDNPSLKDLQGTSIVGNGQYLVASISVAKGQDVGIAMGTLGTDCHLRFVYAKGSEPQQ